MARWVRVRRGPVVVTPGVGAPMGRRRGGGRMIRGIVLLILLCAMAFMVYRLYNR